MKTPNKVLMDQAKDVLKGKWGLAVKVTFLYWLLSIGVSLIPAVGSIGSIIIAGPLTLGLSGFWLAFSKREYLSFGKIFEGFDNFWRAFKVYILTIIYTLLWTLLLIIPGIIAAYSYSVAFFVLAEDKTIGANAALRKSKELMKGNKLKLFRLHLRFLGWGFLCLLTLGIGFLWLTPYMYVTFAKFYEDIKGKSGEKEIPEVVPVPKA